MEIDISNEKVFIVGNFDGEVSFDKESLKSGSSFNITLCEYIFFKLIFTILTQIFQIILYISSVDLFWTWKIHTEPRVIDGKVHLNVTKFSMRPAIRKMRISMPEIFQEDPAMSKNFIFYLLNLI